MSEHGYGGFWIRSLALLVDSVIVMTGVVVIALVILKFLGPETLIWAWFGLSFGPILYWVVMHASERQATYGKALLGMMVTTAEGDRISLPRSLARELGKILSGIPMMLGYVAAAFTTQKQALHDVVASTTVVRHDSGRVGLGLLIGVFGWVVPVAIVVFAGGGLLTSLASQLNNARALPSAMGGLTPDTTAPEDSSIRQAAMTAPRDTAPPDTATRTKVAAPSPTEVAATPQAETKAIAQPPTPQPQPSVALATAPAEAVRRPAQRPRIAATVEALDAEAAAAMDQLSMRFATEVALVPARFQDRAVQLYDFGAVPRGAGAARVFWPIHGFDARGNPVAIRGQRPIFTTVPRLGEYSGLWQLVYVVTADMAQPNALSDAAAVDAAVRARRAMLRDAELVLNLPIVPRGTTLARDTTRALLGWYRGWEVQFFDFGAAAPMLGFAAARDSAGDPIVLSADSAAEPRNLQIAIVDGTPATRVPSPLRAFADMRTQSPPRPTRSP